MIKNLISSFPKLRFNASITSSHLYYLQHFNFTVKPGPFITTVDGIPKMKRAYKKKDKEVTQDNSPVVDSPKVLFKQKPVEEIKDQGPENSLYVEEESEKENKGAKKKYLYEKTRAGWS